MRLLNGKLELLGIDDVEQFCGFVVQRSGLRLSAHDQEELTVWLIEECWRLSLRYQAGGITFSTWARHTLSRRVVDWQRSRYCTRWVFKGHVHERPRPQLVSLDADDEERDRVESSFAASSVDGDTSGFAADMRALGARARRPGGRYDPLGETTDW